ncbi:transglutaminase TgpA family protein [Bacillus sp. JJ1764]|uniref:transglutaminase TgpA family protein n=1 Tax=Bacillus sp. JJ1764 TaxID=3122964 RepID=UPI002FFE88D3
MTKRDFPTFLLYFLGFMLLWEWLRPVEELTKTNGIEMFIGFLLVSFGLFFLKIKWFWHGLINLLIILISMNRLYFDEGFFHFQWLKDFSSDLIHNIGYIASRDWNELSNEFRSLLFFILLWLMVYLIHYWLIKRSRIFIFFFLTLVYITVLDTFTTYSAKTAIVRTVIVGFTVMGMLTYYRMQHKEKLHNQPAAFKKWMVPILGMIAISVLFGIMTPKAAPLWPDPVPYLKATGKKGEAGSGGAGPHRVGYGTNDAALGGPFIADNKPVFKYEASGKFYWKMETKDTYTGKGWIPSGAATITYEQDESVPIVAFPSTLKISKETAIVKTNGNYQYPYLMYPFGIKKVLKISPIDPDGNVFLIDKNIERIGYYNHKQRPSIPWTFAVEFEVPEYTETELKATTEYNSAVLAPEFYKRYTQVPDKLPDRVRVLAEKITAGETNWYDKAKVVESYFSSNEYTYDQKNVAVPGKNIDYVDQFLFETKKGYCDNFSSSMAVLLRSIGIPTRWVKGFNGGEFVKFGEGTSGTQIFEVKNKNAHSWVEVYFPNLGWVPFEPTKGFSNPIDIDFGTEQPSSGNQTPAPPSVNKPVQKPERDPEATKIQSEKSADVSNNWRMIQIFFKENWKLLTLIMILISATVTALYRVRGKWLPYLILLRFRFNRQDEAYGTAYLVLLQQLERYGLKRKDHQTLRNYAIYVDQFFSSREMTRLTSRYEQFLYSRNLPEGSWKEDRKLWENLIKKTIA